MRQRRFRDFNDPAAPAYLTARVISQWVAASPDTAVPILIDIGEARINK